MTAELMTHEDLLKAYREQKKELEKLRSDKERYETVVKDLSKRLDVSEKRVDALIARGMNNSPRAVEDFKIVNMNCKYRIGGSDYWEEANERLSRLVNNGFVPYGDIKNTDNGPLQAMIKYEEETNG